MGFKQVYPIKPTRFYWRGYLPRCLKLGVIRILCTMQHNKFQRHTQMNIKMNIILLRLDDRYDSVDYYVSANM